MTHVRYPISQGNVPVFRYTVCHLRIFNDTNEIGTRTVYCPIGSNNIGNHTIYMLASSYFRVHGGVYGTSELRTCLI